jgi:cellulose synthase/poly-beta-1,6-N-acetylglucosamine synthase-like glycosyltransferase
MTGLAIASLGAFAAGLLFLVYIYWGYGAVLRLLAHSRRGARVPPPVAGDWPRMTVLLTVYNEERNIRERLADLARQDYPADRFDVVVCSDGSTDATEALAEAFEAPCRISVIRSSRLGKSGAQNAAMPRVGGDIVVLTDAEARFDRGFLRAMARAFADPQVGCATAHLQFVERSGGVAANQGRYWAYELALRDMESRLGILAVASGQAMAFRRALFRPLPTFVGDDCVIPLDVVEQGYRVVHCRDALAYDVMENEAGREFRTRVRMTLRNWLGTWRYPSLLNPFRRFGYAFALWSHKLLRWLGWIGIALMLLGSLGLLVTGTAVALAVLFGLGLLAGAAGGLAESRNVKLPVANTVYSFLLANTAFMVGVIRAWAGDRIVAYRSGSLGAH